MHVSHSLLTLGAAAACWIIAGVSYEIPRTPSDGTVEPHNPLAISRSAYGSLIARLMKDSLESYWHGGTCSDPSHDHGQAPAGRFANRQGPAQQKVRGAGHDHDHDHDHDQGKVAQASAARKLSWIERTGRSITQLEHMRSVRNSPFAVAPMHRLFLSASADWRVHLAWQLDPGDSALYEIDHYVSLSRAPSADAAKRKSAELAQRTIMHALSPHAGPVDALTGAGAAINLLNHELMPDRRDRANPTELLHDWRVLKFCLNRHRQLRQEADEEDWWNDIPDVRRAEIEIYARMLEHLSATIHKQLASNGTINP
jgi:hypothetical protein